MASFVELIGSTIQEQVASTLRTVRVDDAGRLQIVTPAGVGMLIAGVAGDDTTENPFRQVDFIPQAAGDGWRNTLTGVNQELGALTVDKTHHVTPSVDCWVLVGPTGGTAVVGDNAGAGTTHLAAGKTYEYIPRTGFDFLAFIKDTSASDGYIAVSRVES